MDGDGAIALYSPHGFTLMQCLRMEENHRKVTAVMENIMASCGGNMSCSTCIVKIHDDFIDRLEPMEGQEYMLIDIFLDQYGIPFIEGQYRLSCQIVLTESLNGLKFYIPSGNS
jgi:ferredoxin